MFEDHQKVRFRGLEYFHIYLWLLKDVCWIIDWKLFGTFMIVPTISFAVLILWLQRAQTTELIHNIAVLSWILANSIWMIGEFFYDDSTRPIAIIFFGIGLGILTIYYVLTLMNRYRGVG